MYVSKLPPQKDKNQRGIVCLTVDIIVDNQHGGDKVYLFNHC